VNHLLRNDFVGGLHGGVNVAFAGRQFVSNVVLEVFVDEGVGVYALDRMADERQLLHHNPRVHDLGGIAGGVHVCRDNRGYRMTDEERLVGRKHTIIRHFQTGERGGAGNRPNFFRDVLAGVNRDDAWHFQSFSRVNARDTRVRINRSHKCDVQRVRQPDVIDVMSQTFDQPRVFGPLDSLPTYFQPP